VINASMSSGNSSRVCIIRSVLRRRPPVTNAEITASWWHQKRVHGTPNRKKGGLWGLRGVTPLVLGAGRLLVPRLTRLAYRDATCEQTVDRRTAERPLSGKAAVAADAVSCLRLGQSATEIHVCGNGSISAHSETSWK